MLTTISVINEDFLNGLYCNYHPVIIHKWTGYVNASEICDNYQINYFNFTKQPIYLSTCEYIKKKLGCKPTHLMPHCLGQTQGVYIHPLLLPYLIIDGGYTNFLNPVNDNKTHNNDKFLTEFKKLVKEFKPIFKNLFDEIKPIIENNDSDDDSEITTLLNLKQYEIYSSESSDSEKADTELLRQKIKRQIKKLKKSNLY